MADAEVAVELTTHPESLRRLLEADGGLLRLFGFGDFDFEMAILSRFTFTLGLGDFLGFFFSDILNLTQPRLASLFQVERSEVKRFEYRVRGRL